MQEDDNESLFYTSEELVAFCNDTLPCHGVVNWQKEDNYYYALLPEEWQAQTSVDRMVQACQSIMQYDKKVQAAVHELRKKMGKDFKNREAQWFPVPSAVGMHVSLGKCSRGKQVSFTVDRVIGYDNHNLGKPSRWDKGKLVARTFALKVDFGPEAAIEKCSSTHISIAAVGFIIA